MILHEVSLGGVMIAPIALYALLALVPTLALRSLLWRTGLAGWFWHLPLMEVALFVCILFLLVRHG